MAQQGEIQQFAWEGRSHGQLQEIVQRGIAGGDEFVAAAREMERRSREHTRAEEIAATEAARINRKRRLIALAIIAALLFAVVLAEVLTSVI